MIDDVRIVVKKRLEEDGCIDSERLFRFVFASKSMNHQPLNYLDMVKIMLKFVGEGWVMAEVKSTEVLDWDWCKNS